MEEQIEQINQEQINQIDEEQTGIDRSELNIQKFMDDMRLLGDQVRDKNLAKPVFHYGDGAVTNYLLWLILGELQILNDELKGGD